MAVGTFACYGLVPERHYICTSRHPINVCTRRVAYHHSEWIIADGVGCRTDDADTMFHLAVEQIMYLKEH
jgi:hypothetical protein